MVQLHSLLFFFPATVQLRSLLSVKRDFEFIEIYHVVKRKDNNLKVKTIPINGPAEEILFLYETLQSILQGKLDTSNKFA